MDTKKEIIDSRDDTGRDNEVGSVKRNEVISPIQIEKIRESDIKNTNIIENYITRDYSESITERKSIMETPGGNYYITFPWSPQVYFSVRGADNFHIYLWIAKDLSWTQGNYWSCMVFGCLALAWCLVLSYHALASRNMHEVYMLIPLMMWLSANFLWMDGEVFNGDDDLVVPKASYIMMAAISWIGLYHLILRPLKLLPPDKDFAEKYEEADLHPRFSYFENWRQYEHAHTLCWLAKDLSWIQVNPISWVIFLVPTFLIGLDFIWNTFKSKKMMIDCVHYIAQLMWVLGNAAWAFGQLYSVPVHGDDDVPYSMWDTSMPAVERCRWWSSWLLLGAFVPIFILYCFWLPLTCMGKIKAADIPQNRHISRASIFS